LCFLRSTMTIVTTVTLPTPMPQFCEAISYTGSALVLLSSRTRTPVFKMIASRCP
jgi:hypothetical protein